MSPDNRPSLLEQAGVLNMHGHFVISRHTWEHSGTFLDTDRIIADRALLETICDSLVGRLGYMEPTAILYPETCMPFATCLASRFNHGSIVHAIPAERQERDSFTVSPNARCVGKTDMLQRGRILICNTVIAQGSTTYGLHRAVQHAGGTTVGIASIFDRRMATEDTLRTIPLIAYEKLTVQTYDQRHCTLCIRGEVPINTELGHGEAWLRRKAIIDKQQAGFPK